MLSIIKDFNILEINNEKLKIEYFLSSDYKMLLNLYGHKGSNSKESCLWCKKNLKEPPNIEENLLIERTLDDSYTANGHNEPIINFIEYKNCVIDLLHLLLRVSDHLFEILIAKLIRIDNNSGINLEKRPYFKKFMDFLINKCKISNPWYISSKSDDKIKLRSLNGNERITIFQQIFKEYDEVNIKTGKIEKKRKNFSDIFPKSPDKEKHFIDESNVWFVFYKYLNSVKQYDIIDLDELDLGLKRWLKTYLKILWENLRKNTIPPYIHVMCFHLCEMLEKFGSINNFTTQSLEKLNDFTTQYYHSSTNKKNFNKNFLLQLINKRNRIEFYQLEGNQNDFIRLKKNPRKTNFYNDTSTDESSETDESNSEGAEDEEGEDDDENENNS
jgi:hypothetical protein